MKRQPGENHKSKRTTQINAAFASASINPSPTQAPNAKGRDADRRKSKAPASQRVKKARLGNQYAIAIA